MLGDNVDSKTDFAGVTPNPVLEALTNLSSNLILDPGPQNQNRIQMMNELLTFCNKFILDSNSWRRTSFEVGWHLYQRNSDAIYDPALLVKKESWQSRAFVPLTPTHRENIKASLFKMIFGANPPLEIRPRYTIIEDQSDNIRDLILREMERTRFSVAFDKVLDDATTYGSGFSRIRWEEVWEDRLRRHDINRPINVNDDKDLALAFKGHRPPVAYGDEVKSTRVYRGIKFEWLNIWDIFPDPKALTVKGNNIAYRFKQEFGEVVEGVKRGYYFPEAIDRLVNAPSREIEPVEKNIVFADRMIAPSNPMRTQYSKKLENYELYARLPKKWVLVRGEPIDDPDKLVPARVLFNQAVILSVEMNEAYNGEPPIYKLDYMPVNGQFYGRGVAEMLKPNQEVVNETVNQRIDNVALVLNRMFGVIEKAVVNREDFVSKPGGAIRLDGRYVQDIRQALMAIETPDVTRSAYQDVLEWERYAQERTSSRTNLGPSGVTGDAANRTATGLEIVRQSAGEKFAYIGMLMEFAALYEYFRAFWEVIYTNIQPQDVLDALGQDRATSFRLMTPEQIETQYIYEPQGIFTMENKALTQMRLQGLFQQFASFPWLNPIALFQKECKANSIDPQTLMYTPEEMQQNMQAHAHMSGMVTPDLGQGVQGLGAQMNGNGQQPPPKKSNNVERELDEAAAKVAVKKGMITAKEAADRLRMKYGDTVNQ